MQRSNWDHKIIEMVHAHFGDASALFVIKESTCEPRLMVCVEFVLFDYLVVQVSIEGAGVYFGLILPGYQVALFECALKESDIAKSMDRLSGEARLRIPDKYLHAKGW